MGRVLPEYLSNWTTDKVRAEQVEVIPNVMVEKSRLCEDGAGVELLLNSGEEVIYLIIISITVLSEQITTNTVIIIIYKQNKI